jgi:hypothetical protein
LDLREVIRGWRTLPNKELHNLNTSPNIIMVIKSRRMRWEGHVACMEEKKNTMFGRKRDH